MEHTDEQLTTKQQTRILKRLLSYMKFHKVLLFWAMLFLALGTGAELIGPILIQTFIDDYLTPAQFPVEPLIALAVTYIILHVSAVFFNYFQQFWFDKAALRMIQRMRVEVFGNVAHMGLSFFDRTATGGIISRLTNDTERIKEFYVNVLSMLVQNFVFFIGIFAAMFYLNVQLALFCLALLPVVFILLHTYRKFSAKYYGRMSGKLSELNARLNESIQGMAIIQIFRQERRMRREFAELNDEHHRAWLKGMKLDGLLLRPAVDFLSIIALMLVIGYFGIISFNSPIEVGVLYAFVNYLERFFEPVNQMMARLSIFQQAIVAAGRVFKLIDHDEPAPPKRYEGNPQITRGRIEFKNVSFSYDQTTPVLKNISFTIDQGETLAFVGHTGSGKSSVINLLMRFYEPDEGEILLDGEPLAKYSKEELRKKLGLVLQDSHMFSGDVLENIQLYNQEITEAQAVQAAETVRADQFIQKLPGGYRHPVGERGGTFSTGERQLISFARTMALNPKVLVLDEATANIDTETEELIQAALETMKSGRTTIAIAHRLSTIKQADKIVVLHQGEIQEAGNHEELLQKEGLYYNMYVLQQGRRLEAKISG
ncbi:ATP-binding cassette subfamily B protein [Salsuginibacillus halophilus]|uniref:ATP-binding cassette subfamily B protein n=1 Tax=Salsuginibacillus halophilus TaxID=517424 RepID=A0A2P8HYM0_9BACI|nr:ABC transporter ATP-binding protein [Salsuginibacillus halophilus]PSL51309.1 ATP-binding cassette subfamily B protein [Salsuginibacillus halophilus]